MTGITRAEAAGYAAEYQPGEPMGDLARSLIAALDERDAAEDRAKRFAASEKELSDAYLRIRGLLCAWDTAHGGADRFAVTEDALKALLDRSIAAEATATALTTRVEKLREALGEAVEIAHKAYVAATMEAVNAGPNTPVQKQLDAWRVRCMNAETKGRAALKETPNA